jgi:stage II sporulation protein M
MWTSINKKLYLFIVAIFIVGLITGLLFVKFLDESSLEVISLNINEFLQNMSINNISNIGTHILILSVIIVLSVFLIGIIPAIFFIFYNGFSAGFIIISLSNIFGFKGFIYSIIYLIITKLIFLIILSIITVSLIKLVKVIIDHFLNHTDIKNNLLILFKKIFILFSLIIINDTILYFFGVKLINIFNFLII